MEFIENNRKFDHVSERAIDEFLIRFFYKKSFNKIQPVLDKATQLKGIDIIADGLKIDNKAMSDPQYLNNPANSFVLEICSFAQGQYQLGWFLHPDLETTHYLFVWLHEVQVQPGAYITNSKQIQRMEVMLVNKEKIHQYINTYHSDQELKDTAKLMVLKKMDRKYTANFGLKKPTIHFAHSIHKAEGPVTLVVPKHILKLSADKHCMVTPQSIIEI